MELCWEERPADRPTFDSLQNELRDLMQEQADSAGMSDVALHRLSKYARNLEKLVAARARDALHQTKRLDAAVRASVPR